MLPDIILEYFMAAPALEGGVCFMLLSLHLPISLHSSVVELTDKQNVLVGVGCIFVG